MDKPTIAILLTLGVHLVGIVALLWLAFDGRMDWRTWWPSPDDDGGGERGPEPPAPVGPDGGGLPLPDAEPAAFRLRTAHDRAPAAPRRSRRPAHAPEPVRVREPS